MLPRTFNKVRMSMFQKLKSCQPNCSCSFRMKMLLAKNPMDIIDETFIKIQIIDHKEEYLECYNSKINKNN